MVTRAQDKEANKKYMFPDWRNELSFQIWMIIAPPTIPRVKPIFSFVDIFLREKKLIIIVVKIGLKVVTNTPPDPA